MIRIAICDDDITSLELLYHLVCAYLREKTQEEFMVRRFQSVYDLLECLESPNLSFHIYFLDIIMPMYNGIEVARMIRENDEYAVIVYTTSSSEYAMDALSTAPQQYLLKPIELRKLQETLDSACRKVERLGSKNMLIKRKDGLANVGLHQIEYIEYRDHALTFYLTNGKTIPSRVIHESFSWVVDNVLNDPRFIKPHASYVINMDHVQSMNGKDFEMNSGAWIPISKRIYTQVKQQFVGYMMEKNGAMVL